jgi:hypothetical protein
MRRIRECLAALQRVGDRQRKETAYLVAFEGFDQALERVRRNARPCRVVHHDPVVAIVIGRQRIDGSRDRLRARFAAAPKDGDVGWTIGDAFVFAIAGRERDVDRVRPHRPQPR